MSHLQSAAGRLRSTRLPAASLLQSQVTVLIAMPVQCCAVSSPPAQPTPVALNAFRQRAAGHAERASQGHQVSGAGCYVVGTATVLNPT